MMKMGEYSKKGVQKFPVSQLMQIAPSLVEKTKDFIDRKFEHVPQELYEVVDVWNEKTCRLNREFRCKSLDCLKVFTKSSEFRNHLKKHTKERPHQCHFCRLWFSQKGNLRRHLQDVHSFIYHVDLFQEYMVRILGHDDNLNQHYEYAVNVDKAVKKYVKFNEKRGKFKKDHIKINIIGRPENPRMKMFMSIKKKI